MNQEESAQSFEQQQLEQTIQEAQLNQPLIEQQFQDQKKQALQALQHTHLRPLSTCLFSFLSTYTRLKYLLCTNTYLLILFKKENSSKTNSPFRSLIFNCPYS
ncbi:hypothetical protein CWR48_05555 [Oceanobacillus arenosus]|uniref:Uncharacterized protein n=1 Tax=Oceanobacillus arenosus TaxID=1229153 RepID=A0A3D8PWM8_9BACI|nr:hypothetical protein [Oceanobacillus arenosus]RDW20172.1 hypothetical protein CWR48_05555 [Oceanobacillus arenosus]